MPGADCYITDPDGIKVPLMLYGDAKTPPQLTTTWAPADSRGAVSDVQDVRINDWKNGMGYSQPGTVEDGYAFGTWFDGRSPGLGMPSGQLTEVTLPTLPGIVQTVAASFILGTDLYFCTGRSVVKMASSTADPILVHDLGSDSYEFTSACVVDYGGVKTAFLGHGSGSGGFTKFDGTTWTSTNALSRFFCVPVNWTVPSGVTVRRLFAADTDYSVKHCALTDDPMIDGNWSAQIVVGEGAYKVRSTAAATRHAYVCTEGGVYDVNELSETLPLTPYLADLQDIENGLHSLFYDRFLMYAGFNFLDAVDVSQNGLRHAVPSFAHPGAAGGLPNETPVWGRPTAFTTDQGWLVASFFNNYTSYVCYGMRRERLGYPGPGDWVWHGALASFDRELVTHLRVRTVTVNGVRARRLYIGTQPYDGNGTGGRYSRLYYQSLPRAQSQKQEYDTLVAAQVEVPHRWHPGFTLVNTRRDWAEPTREKTLTRIDVGSGNLGASAALGLAVSESDSDDYVSAGSANSSPTYPIPLTTSLPMGLQIGTRVDASGTETVPPIMRSLTLRAAVNEEQAKFYVADFFFAKEQEMANGALASQRSAAADLTRFESMQNRVCTFVNPGGAVETVLVEAPITARWAQAERSVGQTLRGWGWRVSAKLRVLDSPSLYDVAVYGAPSIAAYS